MDRNSRNAEQPQYKAQRYSAAGFEGEELRDVGNLALRLCDKLCGLGLHAIFDWRDVPGLAFFGWLTNLRICTRVYLLICRSCV